MGKCDLLLGNIILTEKQAAFHRIMTNYNTKVVFLNGPAGTSKTFLSTYAALDLYNKDNRLSLLYLRTVIESASKSLGFLKGDLNTKISPYLKPMEDKVAEILSPVEQQAIKNRNVMSAEPINFIRGADWKNKVVIFDEAQNATVKEILTVATRLSHGSKLFICGDTMQSDIQRSGFGAVCNAFANDPLAKEYGVHVLSFDANDCMRDPVVSYLMSVIAPLDTSRN